MKKIVLLLIVCLVGCQEFSQTHGIIGEKGIDRIDIKALYDSFKIKSAETDINTIEMYWVRVYGKKDKIYISPFCYEEYEIKDIIEFEYCKDQRFELGE